MFLSFKSLCVQHFCSKVSQHLVVTVAVGNRQQVGFPSLSNMWVDLTGTISNRITGSNCLACEDYQVSLLDQTPEAACDMSLLYSGLQCWYPLWIFPRLVLSPHHALECPLASALCIMLLLSSWCFGLFSTLRNSLRSSYPLWHLGCLCNARTFPIASILLLCSWKLSLFQLKKLSFRKEKKLLYLQGEP